MDDKTFVVPNNKFLFEGIVTLLSMNVASMFDELLYVIPVILVFKLSIFVLTFKVPNNKFFPEDIVTLLSIVVVSLGEAFENPLVIVFNVARLVLIVLIDDSTSAEPTVKTLPGAIFTLLSIMVKSTLDALE
jgi:hypothetical protein